MENKNYNKEYSFGIFSYYIVINTSNDKIFKQQEIKKWHLTLLELWCQSHYKWR